ncbi:MAG: type II secretion system protein GspK [Candidatus Acidiferrales bacterium]
MRIGREIAVCAGMLLMATQGIAQQPAPQAKVDWTAFLPAGEGKIQTSTQCVSCHTLQAVITDRRGDDAEWLGIVQTMVYVKNAPIADDDIPIIAGYLAKYFGPSTPKLEMPVRINVNTAPKQVLLMIGTLSEEDVQKIIEQRAKQKIANLQSLQAVVGPGKLDTYDSVIRFNDEPEGSSAK